MHTRTMTTHIYRRGTNIYTTTTPRIKSTNAITPRSSISNRNTSTSTRPNYNRRISSTTRRMSIEPTLTTAKPMRVQPNRMKSTAAAEYSKQNTFTSTRSAYNRFIPSSTQGISIEPALTTAKPMRVHSTTISIYIKSTSATFSNRIGSIENESRTHGVSSRS